MLANTLTVGDVKDSAGAGSLIYSRISSGPRTTEFASTQETPARPDRFKVSHLETNSGFLKRRRSMVRFDVTVPSDVDATKNVVVSAYVVFDAPVGALIATTHLKDTLSKLGSLVFTTVASVNFKFDGTGNGAVDLLRGEL